MITVNQTKATEITKTAIRAYRDPLLATQDVLYQRALETNADTSEIVATKQVLRDMTATADDKTVEELKVIIAGLV